MHDLFRAPKHPYTQALLGSMPKLGNKEPLYAIPVSRPISPSSAQDVHFIRAAPMLCRNARRGSQDDRHIASNWTARCWLVYEPARNSMSAPLLELQNLQKYFPVGTGVLRRRKIGWVKAVDGVDITIDSGETLGRDCQVGRF